MKRTLLLIAALLFLSGLHAQTISLVKSFGLIKVPPNEYKECNGWLYFTINKELWRTDGTEANTTLIKSFPRDQVFCLTDYNNRLYFIADDSTLGLELWSTSGTSQGTAIVKDINPGKDDGVSGSIAATDMIRIMNGNMYFFADDSVHGFELYRSDGTATGTNMVKDIDTAYGKSGIQMSANGPTLEVMNGKLYFGAHQDAGSPLTDALWSSDGTEAGTQAFYGTAPVINLMLCGSKLYFSVTYYNNGYPGLYVTDGTPGSVTSLGHTAINAKTDFTVLNDKLFFVTNLTAGDSLYIADDSGVRSIAAYRPGSLSYPGAGIYHHKSVFFTTLDNRVYFSNDGQLWVSDGTVAGTGPLVPALPSENYFCSPTQLTAAYGKLYFRSADLDRVGLWRSDGTRNGTYQIKKTDANCKVAAPWQYRNWGAESTIYPYNNHLYFLGMYDTAQKMGLYRVNAIPGSVNSVAGDAGVLVYPNPVIDQVTVAFDNNRYDHLKIIDQSGRQLYSRGLQPAERRITIPLAEIPAGIYYLLLSDRTTCTTRKIVVE